MIQHAELEQRKKNVEQSRDVLIAQLADARERVRLIEDELLRVDGALQFADAVIEQSAAEESQRKTMQAVQERLQKAEPEKQSLTVKEIMEEIDANK